VGRGGGGYSVVLYSSSNIGLYVSMLVSFICRFFLLILIQTPEDGHIGLKHVVLSESEGEK
jgi:hypothetical protein